VGEVFRATDDRTNIALLLVLESTGHVFFTRVVDFLERLQDKHHLYYFARAHLDVELGHELFEERMNSLIDSIEMTPDERAMVTEAVDNSFDAMTGMLENLTDQVRRRTTLPPPSMESVPPASMVLSRVNGPKSKRKLALG
jgi:hypothetical protein